jgi:hypothetical protein
VGDDTSDTEDGEGSLYDRLMASVLEEDAYERAALALLHLHGYWLDDAPFVGACVHQGHGQAWVLWLSVKRFVKHATCSALEREVLLLAFDLVETRSGRRFQESAAFDQLDPGKRETVAATIGWVAD